MNEPTVNKLQKILCEMHKKPSMVALPSIIKSVLDNKPSDIKKFSFVINGKSWVGYIYIKRNSLYGSLFTFYDSQPFIVRGFPKINYVEDSPVLNQKNVFIEEKVDGTNIVVWCFPDGTFWGKTRLVPTIFHEGYNDVVWFELLKKTGYVEKLQKLCKTGFQIAMELYGRENTGEFIKYSTPINIKILEIVTDNTSFNYCSPDMKEKICKIFNLPVVEQKEICCLTEEDYDRLIKEAEKFNHDDGYEGFVAKWFDNETRDVHMAKIKCKDIREMCYGNKIPMRFIRKALHKLSETNIPLYIEEPEINGINKPSKSINEEAITFIKDELLEDYSETVVNLNEIKIKFAIENPLKDNVIDLTKFEDNELFKIFKELENNGVEINLDNKRIILSTVAGRIPNVDGGRLFLNLKSYLRRDN